VSERIRLVGVYKADGGFIGELSYFFGHLIGVRECSLCDVTHSPVRKKAAFKKFEERLLSEFGLEFRLVHLNERTEAELAASEGRAPCVLLEYSDGSLSMLIDWQDLKVIKGSVEKFERLVRTRLDLYG
jgi:glutaredoxin